MAVSDFPAPLNVTLPFELVQEFTGSCSETGQGISDSKDFLDPVHLASSKTMPLVQCGYSAHGILVTCVY